MRGKEDGSGAGLVRLSAGLYCAVVLVLPRKTRRFLHPEARETFQLRLEECLRVRGQGPALRQAGLEIANLAGLAVSLRFRRTADSPLPTPARRLIRGFVGVAAFLFLWAALDDITTGPESSLFWEWMTVLLGLPVLIVLAWGMGRGSHRMA